jgi:hypothetical protein
MLFLHDPLVTMLNCVLQQWMPCNRSIGLGKCILGSVFDRQV